MSTSSHKTLIIFHNRKTYTFSDVKEFIIHTPIKYISLVTLNNIVEDVECPSVIEGKFTLPSANIQAKEFYELFSEDMLYLTNITMHYFTELCGVPYHVYGHTYVGAYITRLHEINSTPTTKHAFSYGFTAKFRTFMK